MEGAPLVVFRARSRLCGLPIAATVETTRPLPIEAFAGTPPYVLGLSIIRGHATPVVDAGALLECASERDTRRFLVLRTGARHVALAVEEVVGVRRFAAGSVGELPSLLDPTRTGVVDALGAHDRELLVVLHTARLIPEETWRALDARGAVA